MVEVVGALRQLLLGVHVEREKRRLGASRPRLGEGAPVVGVVEPVTPPMVAEVVVERAVLLHQEHHVLDGAKVSARRLDRRGLLHCRPCLGTKCPADRNFQGNCRTQAARQNLPTIKSPLGHDPPSLVLVGLQPPSPAPKHDQCVTETVGGAGLTV